MQTVVVSSPHLQSPYFLAFLAGEFYATFSVVFRHFSPLYDQLGQCTAGLFPGPHGKAAQFWGPGDTQLPQGTHSVGHRLAVSSSLGMRSFC